MLNSTEAILSFSKGKRRGFLNKDRLLLSAILPLAIVDLSAAFTQAQLHVISDVWY